MFHYFTIKFHFSFFAYFRFKFFASLHLSNFRFEASEAKLNSSLFFRFFHIFCFFSLRFDLLIFASKRNKAKSIFLLFSLFFTFFSLFLKLFFTFFHLIFVSLCFFHLIFAYFTLVFASDFWCFASK